MYDLTLTDRAALADLASDAERMVVQRWMELTFSHTHPEWRLRGHPPGDPEPAKALLSAVAQERVERTYHAVADLAASMLLAGGNDRWQFQAVRSYLLNGARRSGRSFSVRLADLCPESWSDAPEEQPPTVAWRSLSELPRHARMPWTGAFPASAAGGPAEEPVVAGTETSTEGKRVFTLKTRASGSDPRLVSEAAARLHFQGTVVLDLARLTVQRQPLTMAPQIDVEGPTAPFAYQALPGMPRLVEARLRRIAAALGARFRAHPEDLALQRAIAALRWISLAHTRWPESPAMAAGLAYIALDTAHNGCIVRHREDGRCSCGAATPAALDRYVETLRERLALDVEKYLLRVRGKRKDLDAGRRDPERWMSRVRLSRDGESLVRWIDTLLHAMSRGRSKDPLLRFHLVEIRRLHGRRLAAVRERCAEDLAELRAARNALVHDKDLLLAEQRTAYLAALATEMVLLHLEAAGAAA